MSIAVEGIRRFRIFGSNSLRKRKAVLSPLTVRLHVCEQLFELFQFSFIYVILRIFRV